LCRWTKRRRGDRAREADSISTSTRPIRKARSNDSSRSGQLDIPGGTAPMTISSSLRIQIAISFAWCKFRSRVDALQKRTEQVSIQGRRQRDLPIRAPQTFLRGVEVLT